MTNGTSAPPATGALDLRQRFADELETIQTAMDGRQTQIHTMLPGQIVSYNAATMTAVVQPAVQTVQVKIDGTRQGVPIAQIHDVPIVFPGGGGHLFTFPIAAGDECILLFAERNIDAWFQHGGVLPPMDWRMHDITDAVALVGIRSQPNVPGSTSSRSLRSASPVSPNTVQLRSNDGATLVQIDGANGNVTVTAHNNVQLQGNASGNLGFFSATPVAKPTITGSKQGNPALTSLLQHLAQLGLVTDNTT